MNLTIAISARQIELADVTAGRWYFIAIRRPDPPASNDHCPYRVVRWLDSASGYPAGFFDRHGSLYRHHPDDLILELSDALR